MPQRQQTQGDFGLRPTKVTQGITDVYHAPSIPKPDMSGLETIANLSKTAMSLVQEQHRLDVRDAKFAQEEAAAHEKTGREFGEANPFAEFPRGSTEAMILGGRKGRASAIQSMYRNAVKEGFPSYLLANPEEATNPDAFFNFADEAYNEWASTHAESLGELGLQEFASTHIEWRHHQGAIHGNKAIAQGVEDFIGVSDTIMPQTLTELESINSAIDGYSDSQITALFPEYDSEEEFNVEEHRQLLREQYGTVPMQNLQNYLGEAHRMGDDVLRQAVDRISTDLIKEMTDGVNPIAAHTMLLNLQTGSGAFVDRPEVNEKYRNSLKDFETNVKTLNAGKVAAMSIENYLNPYVDISYDDSQRASGKSGSLFTSDVEKTIYSASVDEDGVVVAKAVIEHLKDNTDLPKAPETEGLILSAVNRLMENTVAGNPEEVALGLELYRHARDSVSVMDKMSLDADQITILDAAMRAQSRKDFQGIESLPHTLSRLNLNVGKDLIPNDRELAAAIESASASAYIPFTTNPSTGKPYSLGFLNPDSIDAEHITDEFTTPARDLLTSLAQLPENSHLNKEQLIELTLSEMEDRGVISISGRPFQLPEGNTIDDVERIEEYARGQLWGQIVQDRKAMKAIKKEIGSLSPEEFNDKYPDARPMLESGVFGMAATGFRTDLWLDEMAVMVFTSRNDGRSPQNVIYRDADSADDLPIRLYSSYNFVNNPKYTFIDESTGTPLLAVNSEILNTEEFSVMMSITNKASAVERNRRAENFREHKDSTYFKSYPN